MFTRTTLTMNPVPPICLKPGGAKLLANTELLRLSAELSKIYASKEKLVTDEVLQVIGGTLREFIPNRDGFDARKIVTR